MRDDAATVLALEDLAFVEGAYMFALGRAVDPLGLRNYLELLRGGTPKTKILAELQSSDEGKAFMARTAGQSGASVLLTTISSVLGIPDDALFVDCSYRELTGRPPTAAESEKALTGLSEGHRRQDLMRSLRHSPAGRRHIAALEDVHVLDLSANESRQAAALGLEHFLTVTDEAFVHLAYKALLGRDADRSGRANYLSSLRDGMPRISILSQLQNSPEGRSHGATIAGLSGALLRSNGWVTRLKALTVALRRRVGPKASPPTPTEILLHPRSSGGGVVAALSSTPFSELMAITEDLSKRLVAVPVPARSKVPVFNSQNDKPGPTVMQSKPKQPNFSPSRASEASEAAWSIALERFSGAHALGWSYRSGESARCSVTFGGRIIGGLVMDQPRPDVLMPSDLGSSNVGFAALLGGMLHFSAISERCASLLIEQPDAFEIAREFALAPYFAEALSFAPLRSFSRLAPDQSVGRLLSIDFGAANEFNLLFEAAPQPAADLTVIFLDIYQEQTPGSLLRLSRFKIEAAGQVAVLRSDLLSRHAPILLVVTDANRRIVLSDCIPLPDLHAESQRPLMEYHSILTGGQSALDVAAKIGRAYLDDIVRCRSDYPVPEVTARVVSRASTRVLLYSRDHYDFMGVNELQSLLNLSDRPALLLSDGCVQTADGCIHALTDFLDGGCSKHVLFVEVRCRPRPDFWAVLRQNMFRFTEKVQLVHWHSIWIEGASRPYLAKPGLLLHPLLLGQELVPLHSSIVDREAVLMAIGNHPQQFRSGSLHLERVFAELDRSATMCVPVALDTVTWPMPLYGVTRLLADHVPLLPTQSERPRLVDSGISVIVNYRNSPGPTIQCLESIRAQAYGGPIEIILVNNASSPSNVVDVTQRARALFGAEAVKDIDYPYEFNHSAQCNIAAKVAQHDLLLMLSNDSILLSEDALRQAATAALVPWVATAGFRIVGGAIGKRKLQSLGLGVSRRQYLFQGGSPLATYQPPAFIVGFTQQTLGNTFAAVMTRRDVYLELGGLDEDAFPTNYNDVDFCCRASQLGYSHVSIGGAVVEHVGRGSREMDLDLPIDQRILDRCPDLSLLASVGVYQL